MSRKGFNFDDFMYAYPRNSPSLCQRLHVMECRAYSGKNDGAWTTALAGGNPPSLTLPTLLW
eukprot:994835-Amphidinium_carterae.1